MNEQITDFMIDLKTLGTGPNSVMIGVGIAGFNLESGYIVPLLNVAVSPQSCLDRGLEVDGSTINWWMEQSQEARAAVFTDQEQLQEVLFQVQDLFRSVEDPKIWGNGSTSDNVWLASAFKACNMIKPWAYKADRDCRTLVDLAESLGCEDFRETIEFEGEAHNAQDDAVHQAKWVCSYFKFLRTAGAAQGIKEVQQGPL